jgi:hypothetical protein
MGLCRVRVTKSLRMDTRAGTPGDEKAAEQELCLTGPVGVHGIPGRLAPFLRPWAPPCRCRRSTRPAQPSPIEYPGLGRDPAVTS